MKHDIVRHGKLIVFVFASAMSFSLFAETGFTLRDDVSDWTVKESYEENAVPTAGALVYLPANRTVTLDSSDAESWALAESLGRIVPAHSSSRLVVNVASGDASLTVPFSASNDISTGYEKGLLEKTGDGNLFLAGPNGLFVSDDGGSRCDHFTALTVSEGTLTLPQDVAEGKSLHFGNVTVAEGAVFKSIVVAEAYATTVWPSVHFKSLSGKGTITSAGPRPLQILGVSHFEGKFSGILNVYVNGRLTLSGTESDTTGKLTLRENYENFLANVAPGGILYAKKLGKAGEASSVGSADTIVIGDFAGGIVYQGTGETCDKNLQFGYPVHAARPGFIHGGAGGLEWTGAWKQPDENTSQTMAHRLVIMGTNQEECVMSGVIKDGTDDGVLYPITVIKRGSGIWRMAHNDGRTGGGVYSIEEGTLRYDSIAERGEPSALGASDNLVRHRYAGRDLEANRVQHAFLLGSAKGATMEFTGSNGGRCTTRPVAVTGNARFKVSGAGAYSFSGFYAETAGAELVIDTDRTDGYVWLGGIQDGAAPLPVTKEGSGEIKISGGMSFTGPLSVKEGTLTLCATNRQYGWFRWIVKEKGFFCDRYQDIISKEWPSTPDLKMEEFAFFDADGKRIDKGLSYYSEGGGFHLMPEGCVAEENGTFYDFYGDNSKLLSRSALTTLFDGGAGSRSGVWGGVNIRSTEWPFCSLDTPKYWFRLIERLPADSKPVASFDLACFYGSEASNKGMVARGVTALEIQGSVDGVNWEPIVENNALEIPPEGPRWYADTNSDLVSVSGADYTLKDHVGFPMRGFSTNGVIELTMPVSVAPGATLRTDGNVSVSSLVLSKDGNGTIDGFTFSEEGSLSVDLGDYTSGIQTVPVEFKNCVASGNLANWNLSINGGSSRGRKVRVTEDGALELVPPALVIVIK